MRLVGPIFPQNSPNMNVSFTLYDSVLCSLMLKCQVCLTHTHKENFHSFFSLFLTHLNLFSFVFCMTGYFFLLLQVKKLSFKVAPVVGYGLLVSKVFKKKTGRQGLQCFCIMVSQNLTYQKMSNKTAGLNAVVYFPLFNVL